MFAIEAAVAGVGYVTLALNLGVLLAAGFLLTGSGDTAMRRKLAAIVPLLLGALLLIGVLLVIVQGAKLSGGRFPSWDILTRYLTRTQSGKIWLAREIYLLALLTIGFWLLRRKARTGNLRLLFALLLPLIASRGLTGHAMAVRENTGLMLVADAVHITAVSLWAGGLPVLFSILRKGTMEMHHSLAWAAGVVRRFSRVALISVCLLIPSGLYQSVTHVGIFATLISTPYGNVLSVKLLLFAVMLVFGALNRFVTQPAILRAARLEGGTSTNKKIFNPIGWEGCLGVAVLFLTGFLTTLPPGIHGVHNIKQQLPNPTSGQSPVHSHTPAKPWVQSEGAAVKILSPVEGQTFHSDRIPLKFNLTKGKRGHHVHAYVDGELVGMFESKQGTLNGIRPGRHVLELRVVAEDHQTEIDASDRVIFVVK